MCYIPTQWSEQQRTNSNGHWHVGLRRLGVKRAEVHDRRRDDTREVLDRRIGLDIEQPVLRNDQRWGARSDNASKTTETGQVPERDG